MASPQPATRTVAVTAGVGIAALLTAAAAALPAAADPPAGDTHGNSASAPGHTRSHTEGKSSSAHGHGGGKGTANGHDNQDGSAGGSTSTSGPADAQANGQASGHNPPGNNGTVFIHDVAGDEHPHNVPHVSCRFYVDFFNFDNSQSVTVSFAGQAPTGMGTQLGGTTTTTLEADDASGAGHDWDGELAFTADQLGVSQLGAPAHQGYHVKMTVDTNEPGGHKYKVFWIEPCGTTATNTAPTTTDIQSSAANGQSTSNSSTPATSSDVAATTAQRPATASGQSTGGALAPAQAARANSVPTEVLGTKFTRSGATPAAGATASAASLPFTGAEIGAMTLAAIAALGGGVILTVAGRRRRRGTTS